MIHSLIRSMRATHASDVKEREQEEARIRELKVRGSCLNTWEMGQGKRHYDILYNSSTALNESWHNAALCLTVALVAGQSDQRGCPQFQKNQMGRKQQ